MVELLSAKNMSFNPYIAIYLPSLRGGGAERVMVTLANSFAGSEYHVDLVLAHATGPYLAEVSPLVNVIDLRCSRVAGSLPGLISYLRRVRPRVLLSAMRHANLIALLAKYAVGNDTRFIVSERNDATVRVSEKMDLRSLFVRYLAKFLYKRADAIHAVSNGVAAACAKELGLDVREIDVVYNPVDTAKIIMDSSEYCDFSELINTSRPLILGVGRLSKQKDFSTLIRAFALVRKRSDAQLVVLGEGDLRSELEELINSLNLQEFVRLPGFVLNPFPIIRQADVFVLSSKWEGLPNVLIQSMACGTPVVSTDCPSGPAEILENGKWGRLIPVGDVQALADAILATMKDNSHPDVASRAADFGVERVVDGYLDLMHR